MTRHFFIAMLLMAANVQIANAQKVVLHMAGNQKAEYDTQQLDSITFVDVDSPDVGPSTDPSVTGNAIDITNKSATLVGYASSIRDDLANDLRVGFIYCLEGTPNKNNGTQVTVNKNDVADDGRYMAMIENLLSETTYYFRSFVYQSGLWFYGKVKSFITAGIDVNFSTGDATDVTCFSAKVSGSVDVQSTYSSLTYGICYGTSIEPTTNDNTQTASSNNFTLQLRQLTGGTTYYYRPYAIVDGQTYYGTVRTFRTLDDNVVETDDIDEETLTITSHLTIGGGAYSSLVLGVCYGKTELPTINDYTVTSDEVDEENNYTVQLVNPGFGTIHYRAYVLIDGIPHYGASKSFERNYEWVDLGLPSGTLWATCNVGANCPEERGDYFAWGETHSKSYYDWSTYQYCNGSINTLTKYCRQTDYGYNGFTDSLKELLPEDDAATVNWGSEWQMPSEAQLEELKDSNYVTIVYTTYKVIDGKCINGELITSKSNGNSIFLPDAGFYSYMGFNGNGSYWSRSFNLSSSYDAYNLFFSYNSFCTSNYRRHIGQSVRPVRVHGNPKIRIGIYETIPGYSVRDLNFYANEATDITQTSCVLYADADEETFSIDFGILNYTTAEMMERYGTNYLGRSSSTASYAGNAADNYYITCMPNERGTNLNLRVNYKLESTDGSGEVIKVTNASAQVPAEYTKWEYGCAYTYIFKISDLYPIRLDAIVVKNPDGSQQVITL